MQKLGLKNQIEKVIRGENTQFLNPKEVEYIKNNLQKNNIKYQIFKPYNEAEKIVIYQNKLEITLFELESKENLTHKEILGTLFSHNINENFYGDIIINDKYYIIVSNLIKKYIENNLQTIGKKKVKLIERSLESVKDFKPKFKKIKLSVSSLRIDNVISKLVPTSRKEVDKLIENKEVILNYEVLKSKVKELNKEDILSVRKVGKFKVINYELTKNKKYNIEINKYI